MDAAIEEAAKVLWSARVDRGRLDGLPQHCRPPDERQAYRVQDRLHELLRETGHGAIVGHKIGCTTAVMQAFLKIGNSCAGGVLLPDVHNRAATLPFVLYQHAGVECEIAALIGRDLPPRERPYNTDEVAAAIDAYMPAIEIVDDRWVDYRAVDTPTLIADDFFQAACVLGDAIGKAKIDDLGAVAGLMYVNGLEVGRGHGADVLGHPHNALVWLANSLRARGRGLKAGEFVLTGSVVATNWVTPGDSVTVSLSGLGEAQARFA